MRLFTSNIIPMSRSRVVLLGATGSIGRQACDVIRQYPQHFELVGAVAKQDVAGIKRLGSEFGITSIAVEGDAPGSGIATGADAVSEIAAMECDVVCVAIPGAAALAPALAAIDAGRSVALASKEVLVAAGDLVAERMRQSGAQLVPVDSEHSAIWQCLRGEDRASVARIVLTASGGPFRSWPLEEIKNATPEQALRHPNWEMGPKVTIDSATMMNKGLEIIEAHYLFDLPYDQIGVVVHPSSSVHSMVEFVDGATMAQLGRSDMHIPIALALAGGKRLPGVGAPLSLDAGATLEFEAVDDGRFPAVALARRCGQAGGTIPAVMNAANEIAVTAFLEGKIKFGEIVRIVTSVVDEAPALADLSLETITAADGWARQRAEQAMTEVAGQ
jgi:1-deoxy-D-xylulose-5-phosphate reductoisomerase